MSPNEILDQTRPQKTRERVQWWLAGGSHRTVWGSVAWQRADVRAVLGALEDRVKQLERRGAGLLACGEEP